MKILSLVFFAVVMAWTWNVVHNSQSIPYSSHQGLQAEITRIVRTTVMKNYPNAQNFMMHKIWTEELGDDRVRAEYAYSFIEPDKESDLEPIGGIIFLKRVIKDNAEEVWELEKLETSLTFTEGTVIRAGELSEDEITPEMMNEEAMDDEVGSDAATDVNLQDDEAAMDEGETHEEDSHDGHNH